MALTYKPKSPAHPTGPAKTSKHLPPEGEQAVPAGKAKASTGSELDAMLMTRPVRINTSPGGRTAKNVKRRKNLDPEDIDLLLEETGAPMTDELREERQNQLDARKLGGGRIRATKEAVDYRRKQILRLVLRGVPKQTIAEHLGLTIRQVYEDMVEINRDMRTELQNFDYPVYIGMSVAFYDEARNVALRLATDTKEKSNAIKMTALRVAIQAEDSKHDFLTKVGLFKVAAPTDPFNSIQTGRQGSYSDENDINSFLQALTNPGSVVDGELVGEGGE